MADRSVAAEDDRVDVAEILARIVARRWPQAEVAAIERVPGDASSRRYLRCRLRTQPEGDPAPASLVVMLMEDAAVALSSDELSVYGDDGPRELPFVNVQRFLAARTDAVPEIYELADDASWMVLEDVGDVPLWQAANSDDQSAEDLFGRALELLASLQAAAQDDDSGCYAFAQAFDTRLFQWEFEHFLEYGVNLDAAPPSTLAACRRELAAVAERLGALPRTFCHRDYHAWNIHVCNGRLRIIDFQDALMAPALYDVASLLTDRYTPQLVDEAMTRRLVTRYAEAAGRSALPAGDDELLEIYRLLGLQRVLKVIGRFNYLAEVKGKASYLEMLPVAGATAAGLIEGIAGVSATSELLATAAKTASGRARR